MDHLAGASATALLDLALVEPLNAAPEWQAGSLGWLSREDWVACPLEGLVRVLAGFERKFR